MSLHVTIPALLGLGDCALFVLRLVVAIVFGSSGYFHLMDPVGRAKSIELSPAATRALGAAEALGSLGVLTGVLIQPAAIGLMLVGLGAIQKKAFQWKLGFWGNGTNGWLIQEITTRLPGRIDAAETTFANAADLADAMRRAEAAHGEHEKRTGQRDANWSDWYAEYMVADQSGAKLPE